jgi:hypothetical protein
VEDDSDSCDAYGDGVDGDSEATGVDICAVFNPYVAAKRNSKVFVMPFADERVDEVLAVTKNRHFPFQSHGKQAIILPSRADALLLDRTLNSAADEKVPTLSVPELRTRVRSTVDAYRAGAEYNLKLSDTDSPVVSLGALSCFSTNRLMEDWQIMNPQWTIVSDIFSGEIQTWVSPDHRFVLIAILYLSGDEGSGDPATDARKDFDKFADFLQAGIRRTSRRWRRVHAHATQSPV